MHKDWPTESTHGTALSAGMAASYTEPPMNKLARSCVAIGLLCGDWTALAIGSPSQPVCLEKSRWSIPERSPKSILLVPLLRGFPDDNEPESWPEQPAAQLADFYRNRFRARTAWLSGIRTWDDFFIKAEQLRKQGAAFDRVILIGHGALDGPLLNEALIANRRSEQGSESTVARILEAQPGLADTLTITYDASHNPAFAAALAKRWEHLAPEAADDISQALRELEAKLEPPDSACLAYHCPAAVLKAIPDRADRDSKLNACEWVCRQPLYASRWEERIDSGRFARFADSLAALAKPGALIFFGMCNPGTQVSKHAAPWDSGGLLTRSRLAGGPHDTYLHLLAAATGRSVAGPIGNSSAADVVQRVRHFESGKPQRYLRIVAPPASCP
jgi:hypothetical protein